MPHSQLARVRVNASVHAYFLADLTHLASAYARKSKFRHVELFRAYTTRVQLPGHISTQRN